MTDKEIKIKNLSRCVCTQCVYRMFVRSACVCVHKCMYILLCDPCGGSGGVTGTKPLVWDISQMIEDKERGREKASSVLLFKNKANCTQVSCLSTRPELELGGSIFTHRGDPQANRKIGRAHV